MLVFTVFPGFVRLRTRKIAVQKFPETTFNYFRRRSKTSVFTVFSGFKNGKLQALLRADGFSEQRKTPVFTGFAVFLRCGQTCP